MEYKKESWENYKERLISYDYTEEQLEAVKQTIDNSEHCPDEQFKELVAQGVITRIAKVKKKRNYYVTDDGEFVFLNHFNKRFEVAGKFKEE
jgi:hypothetical protein